MQMYYTCIYTCRQFTHIVKPYHTRQGLRGADITSELAASTSRPTGELMMIRTIQRPVLNVYQDPLITLGPSSPYREAVEHFLTALCHQKQARGPSISEVGGVSQMSEAIWSTLRLAITFLGRPDLIPSVEGHKLDVLLEEFGLG